MQSLLVPALLALTLAGGRAADFSFDLPAGPQFGEPEKEAQRERGREVVPMVKKAFASGADGVRIPPGDYRFGKERWDRDGVVFPLEFAGLQREDARPFTIDASGATFWFDLPDDQAPTCHFCVGFKECRNLVFKGATIDRATRGHVEGRITRLDYAGNRIELQLSPGITVPAAFNDKLEQRVVPFRADGTFCVPLYALQRGGVHLKYRHISQPADGGRCWVTMHDTALLDTRLLRVGDGLSCIYTVSSSIELIRCARLTMEDLRVYAPKAWGAEYGGFGAHVWRNCYFGPRPGTSQWQGGEGFMFNATRHGTTLDRVTITHTTDDCANFHGYWGHIETLADNRLTFRSSAEFDRTVLRDAAPGDLLLFHDRNTGRPLGEARVSGVDGRVVIADRPVASFTNAIVEWPDHACAGWQVRNCDWRDNYQRLLIQSGPGTVRDCRFTRWGSATELNSVFPYVEGGIPRDIRIENNVFTDVGITKHAHTDQHHVVPALRNISITGNTFNRPQEAAIGLTGIEGLCISGNTFGKAR